jgi:hypothetical protein
MKIKPQTMPLDQVKKIARLSAEERSQVAINLAAWSKQIKSLKLFVEQPQRDQKKSGRRISA